MFGQHEDQTRTADSGVDWQRARSAHRLPGQPLLGIGATVTVHVVVEIFPGIATYVPTTQPGYVVAIEDITDGVYEVWQPCEEHGIHKFYAQYESDVAEGEQPDLYFLATVIEE